MEKEVATHSGILDVRVWKAPVHRAAKSWTGLSNQTAILYSIVLSTWKLKENSPWVSLFPLRAYVQIYMFLHIRWEKAMAPHSSTLAWKIPWTEESGGLQSMGSLRVGHDWATSLSLFTFIHWRRKWQPTPVFLPGESQWLRSLVGCRLWSRTELDTTEVT